MEVQWPLVLFTLLICLSGGLFGAQGLLAYFGKGAKLQMPTLIVAFVAAGLGGFASFTHLQHWERVFNGFGHLTSGITQEIIAVVVIIAVMFIYFLQLRKTGEVSKPMGIVALVASLLLVFVMGHSYLMPARLVWDTPLLIVFYLANEFLLGALGIWLMASILKAEDVTAPAAKAVLIAAAVQLVVVAAYVGFISTVEFTDLGYYFDPTNPTGTPTDTTAYFTQIVSGNLSLLFWLGVVVVGIAVPAALAFLKKKSTPDMTLTGIASVAMLCALAGGVAFRAIIYLLGSSVFTYY